MKLEWLAVGLVAFLVWLLLSPFLPALTYAFALAVIGNPLHTWLLRRVKRKDAAGLLAVALICLAFVVPIGFLMQVLLREAVQEENWTALANFRAELSRNAWVGTSITWLGSKLDLQNEANQLARSLVLWLSAMTSSVFSGSARAITQGATMVVVLFYFLRDQDRIIPQIKALIPLSSGEADRLFDRISSMLRISLYGKLVTSAVQGTLGGLIFWWLGMPAPIFWGIVMGLLSVLPILGAFVVWVPAAATLLAQGSWGKALLMTLWGVLVVHPVDNFLGPVLVGTKLHMHTLLIFFSIVGGLAAFGAVGLVLGPVVVVVAASSVEIAADRRVERGLLQGKL